MADRLLFLSLVIDVGSVSVTPSNNTQDFYDELAPFYHLVYSDWHASVERQAAALDDIIQEFWPAGITTILDVACGIGTQSIGLAQRGYTVAGSDLSDAAIARARHEAATRGLDIQFSVADVRDAYAHHGKQFDLVIACDNSIPHLLTDDDILLAFEQMYACTRPGGGCLISVRDYDQEERSGVQVKPYGVRTEGTTRYLVFQVWEFDGMCYDVSMYFVEDDGGAEVTTRVMRSRYYAISTDRLLALMRDAGFRRVQRLDDRYFQPVLIGTRE